ncbi:heparinase II/III domain-containing protein [Minwuia sp.]|uniref:heparinase II/III domain-containing protein n=1 Tax=Minwuia sp. TaxID=2493630 RepID=UPI003A8D47C1
MAMKPDRFCWALIGALCAPGAGLAAEVFDPHQNPPTVPREVEDWLTPLTRKELRELPEDGSVQLENPPVFGWKSNRFRYSFEVRIDRNGEPFLNFVTTSNLFRPDKPMPSGTFNWRVRQLDQVGRPRNAEQNEGWSTPRRFEVRKDAIPLVVPDVWTAFATAEEGSRPRSLAQGFRNLNRAQKDVFAVVERRFGKEAGAAAKFADLRKQVSATGDGIARSRKVRSHMRQLMRRLNDALAVYLLHRDERTRKRAADIGLTYLRGVVSFDAFGRTGHAGDDLLNIRVAKTVARAFDILYREMDGGLRAEVRRHVEFRTQAAFDFFLLNDRGNLGQFTLSSHGFQIATHVLAISAMMAGDSDRAILWFRETYPLVSTIVTPWGGGDGGYSNGVNYGVWEFVNHVDSWDIIQNAVGFRYFETAWVRNFAEFLTYFTPPGIAQAGFGDGGEKLRPELWAEIARLYVERGRSEFAQPLLAAWQNHAGGPDDDTEDLSNALLWPRLFGGTLDAPDQPRAAETIPSAAIFPDIGWAAIHSSVMDEDRYSVLFKSSQFGSFSHSHADQNSFVVMGRGKPLLIDSGYYDGYRSAHHNGWTRQTRAHNAITYDGGQGQPIDDPGAAGRLTDYWRCAGAVKLTGQAAKAYGDEMRKAERTLLYLPNGHLLVFDHMESAQPRRWEWNFHAAVPIVSPGHHRALIRNGDAEAEIRILDGPDMKLNLSSGFAEKPDTRLMGKAADQYHGTFSTEKKSRTLTMLTAIRMGQAASGEVRATPRDNGYHAFEAGDFSGSIGEGHLHLRLNGNPLTPEQCAVPPRTLTAGRALRLGAR